MTLLPAPPASHACSPSCWAPHGLSLPSFLLIPQVPEQPPLPSEAGLLRSTQHPRPQHLEALHRTLTPHPPSAVAAPQGQLQCPLFKAGWSGPGQAWYVLKAFTKSPQCTHLTLASAAPPLVKQPHRNPDDHKHFIGLLLKFCCWPKCMFKMT